MMGSCFRIQMRDQGSWVTLGGEYDAETADARVSQFVAACSHNKGTSREFRVIAQDGAYVPKVLAPSDTTLSE